MKIRSRKATERDGFASEEDDSLNSNTIRDLLLYGSLANSVVKGNTH